MISEPAQYEDLKSMLMGKTLGIGLYRAVGIYLPDPTLVIKVSINNPAQNIVEWKFWEEVKEVKGIADWFAPCVAISDCGMFLLQKRIETRPRAEYPKKVPSCFLDLKYGNYGWLNGKFVCCDYGGFTFSHGLNGRLKNANWWEE